MMKPTERMVRLAQEMERATEQFNADVAEANERMAARMERARLRYHGRMTELRIAMQDEIDGQR